MTTPTEPAPPLTDDQLRQIAAHLAEKCGRELTDDRALIGEILDTTFAALRIALTDAAGDTIGAYDLDDAAFDAILDRVAGLIDTATISVTWPDSQPPIPAAGIPAGLVAELALVLAADGLVPEDQVPRVARVAAGLLRVAADGVAPEVAKLRAEVERLTAELAEVKDLGLSAIRAEVKAVQQVTAERDQVACERDGVREELARMAGDLDDARSERDRLATDLREIRAFARARRDERDQVAKLAALHSRQREAMRPVVEAAVAWRACGPDAYAMDADRAEGALVAAVDAYTAPGVDTGTSEARTAGSGDARPADGAVAAEVRTVDLATVTGYVWNDPKLGTQVLAPDEVTVVIGGPPSPRTWALPDELRGDGPCGDCGTLDNIVWFTESVLWNAVMRPPGHVGDPLLCIPCFVKRVDVAGYRPTGWRLLPDWHWETKAERLHRLTDATGEAP